MKAVKNLVGKRIKIVSDNENYIDWIDRNLEISYASNKGNGYDSALYPEMLCDLTDCDSGENCPFALYEYEFQIV